MDERTDCETREEETLVGWVVLKTRARRGAELGCVCAGGGMVAAVCVMVNNARTKFDNLQAGVILQRICQQLIRRGCVLKEVALMKEVKEPQGGVSSALQVLAIWFHLPAQLRLSVPG